MNSTLQCLYRIPDLRAALQQLQPGSQGMGYQATPKRLAEGAKDLFAVSPLPLVFLKSESMYWIAVRFRPQG